MIKKIAYSVVLGAMVAGLGACSSEPDYVNGADPSKAEGGVWYSFFQTYSPGTSETGDLSVSYTVKVVRTTTQGDFTLPISIEPVSGKNATIQDVTTTNAVFKDGESVAEVTWTVTSPTAPNLYTGNLVFDEKLKSPAGYNKCLFSVAGPYVWEKMEGTGAIAMPNYFWFYYPVECEFWKAEGCDRWRTNGPQKIDETAFDWWGSDYMGWPGWPCDPAQAGIIEFYQETNDNGKEEISFLPFCVGVGAFGNGMFYAAPANYKGMVGGWEVNLSGKLDGNFWVTPGEELTLACQLLQPAAKADQNLWTDLYRIFLPGATVPEEVLPNEF